MSEFARDLIHQADRLARLDSRRPKAANLRRAISSAYYGLFHHITAGCGELLVGTSSADRPMLVLLTRAFVHGDMQKACKQLTANPPMELFRSLWSDYGIAANPHLQLVAAEFIYLQELRHAADYDLSRSFTRTEALDAVRRARDAATAWSQVRQRDKEAARLACIVMLLWKPLQNR